MAGFIDKRADEITEFMGVEVLHLESDFSFYNDMVLFIAVKNVFEHSSIVKNLITKGFYKIIYRSYAVLTGAGNVSQKRINAVYTQIDEDAFMEISSVPTVQEETIFEKKDNSVVQETDEGVVANIPWQSVFTNRKKENSSIWSEINVVQLIPHIAFFSYLLGLSPDGPEEYLKFCEDSAMKQKNIMVTDKWRENVIHNRKTVFQQMNLAYELEPDFFIDNAPLAEWNTSSHCFNLKSGKHRAAFLIAKGNKYIPLRISKNDYLLYLNDEDANSLLSKDERLYHHRILHPHYLRLPFVEWDFYSQLEIKLIHFMTKRFMYPLGKISLCGRSMLISLNDDLGSISRTFSYLGLEVTRIVHDETDLVKKIDKLMQVSDTLKDIEDIGENDYDFMLIDYDLYAQVNKEEFYRKCKMGMFLFGPKMELHSCKGTLIFEGIKDVKAWQIILLE
ncbi:MAG: hypothetical protein K2H52_01605 [Lachnospiraceae bacterium]|nr:hypothetical protein [Lachnospiraceae bacterium]